MSFRAVLAAVVDVTLGSLLLLLYVTHAHITMRTRIIPAQWIYAAILFAIAVATGWWLLGRRST